jgi:hypothetical protein
MAPYSVAMERTFDVSLLAVRFVDPWLPALAPSCCANAFTCAIAAVAAGLRRGTIAARRAVWNC